MNPVSWPNVWARLSCLTPVVARIRFAGNDRGRRAPGAGRRQPTFLVAVDRSVMPFPLSPFQVYLEIA
jgi:hypothetical protein